MTGMRPSIDEEPLRGRPGQKLLEVSFHEFTNPHVLIYPTA